MNSSTDIEERQCSVKGFNKCFSSGTLKLWSIAFAQLCSGSGKSFWEGSFWSGVAVIRFLEYGLIHVWSTPGECELCTVSSHICDIPSSCFDMSSQKIVQSVLDSGSDLCIEESAPASLVSVICYPVEERAGCCLEADASDSFGFFELWSSSFGGGLADPEAAESDLLFFVDLPWFDPAEGLSSSSSFHHHSLSCILLITFLQDQLLSVDPDEPGKQQSISRLNMSSVSFKNLKESISSFVTRINYSTAVGTVIVLKDNTIQQSVQVFLLLDIACSNLALYLKGR
ncbi:hypothetical protein Tco_0821006 [Tanacetum coccineum]|uniref:Uncharacterized protein n=1 Tax=Tanacetum coccineum TaxID=301880 RepID=A0ABQ5ADP5_9ASTR